MIDVVVQDENGKIISSGVALPQSIFPSSDDDRFTCVRFIDAYGDTYFNYLQMPYLLDDLRLLKAAASDAGHKAVIEQFEHLVIPFRDERHVYIKCIGD